MHSLTQDLPLLDESARDSKPLPLTGRAFLLAFGIFELENIGKHSIEHLNWNFWRDHSFKIHCSEN